MDVSEVTSEAQWYETRPWIDRADADPASLDPAESQGLFELAPALQRWKDEGIVVFENVIPLALLDDLERDIERFVSDPTRYPIGLDVDGRMREMKEFTSEELRAHDRLKFYALFQFSAAARRLSLDPTVTAFLRCVFRDRPAPMSSLTFLHGSQQPVHADHAYVYRQKHLPMMAAAWIPLEDVRTDAGPLAYYPGSHRVEEFGFFEFPGEGIYTPSGDMDGINAFTGWLGERLADGGYERQVFTPRRGDVLIWHAALVHEGLPIEDPTRTRKSHVTHYTSDRCMPRDHVKRDLLGRAVSFEHGSGVAYQYPWLDGDFS